MFLMLWMCSAVFASLMSLFLKFSRFPQRAGQKSGQRPGQKNWAKSAKKLNRACFFSLDVGLDWIKQPVCSGVFWICLIPSWTRSSGRKPIEKIHTKTDSKPVKDYKTAHIEILVFLIITRHHQVGSGRKQQNFVPTSLPDLSKPSRTSQNFQKSKS